MTADKSYPEPDEAVTPPPLTVAVDQAPEFWRAVLAVMQEAPMPSRITNPLCSVIANALMGAGHSL